MKNIYSQIASLRWRNNRSLSVERFSFGYIFAQENTPILFEKTAWEYGKL